jgi:hypothetical protein
MRKTRVRFSVACCLLALTAVVQAQNKQKPGLWEVTSSMSMGGQGMPAAPQMPPNVQLPPGVQMPQHPGGGPMGGPRTTQVCVTQAMIDKYGGPYSNPQHGDCQVTNISLKDSGMTATLVCTGQVDATGTVESTFVDGNTTETKVHMTGTMKMGSNSRPIDINLQSRSVYKGADCGSVQPMTMPASK